MNTSYAVITAKNSDHAGYITHIYNKNLVALHGKETKFDEWYEMLSENDTDEENFIIYKDAIPVAWLKINGLDGTNTGYISMLAVEPCFQHKGIGRFAVKFAEEFLLKSGKQRIGVQTTDDNSPALFLYKKCGFEEIEKRSVIAEDNSKVIKVMLIKKLR